MDCNRITDHLSPLVDGELEGEHAENVRAHLAECPRCNKSYHDRLHVKHILSTKLFLEKAPPSLRTAILDRLETPRIGDFLYFFFSKLRAKPFLAATVGVTIFLAAFAAVIALVNSHQLPPLVREALAHHVETDQPLNIVDRDAGKVSRAMSSMLGTTVGVPDLRSKRLLLVGGKQWSVCGKLGAHIRYVHPASYVELFIVPVPRKEEIPKLCKPDTLQKEQVGGNSYFHCNANCGRVVMWWAGDSVFLVTSDLDFLYALDIACEVRSRLSRNE
jgi:anti-sigma factor (TIGR02949 family)